MISRLLSVFDIVVLDGAFMIIGCMNLSRLIPGGDNIIGTMVALSGLFIWFGTFISLLTTNFEVMLSRFVPECPLILVPLIVVIEIISYFVRPFALVLRIMVNLTCGHLLLVVRRICRIIGNVIPILLVLVLEVIVAVVQGFVMCMILSL